MPRPVVAGIDSSTQQTKLVVVDAHSGALLHSTAQPHPDGTEISPRHWWTALEGVGINRPHLASAASITAQQHTTIFLNEHGEPARDAILWNDLRARKSADEIVAELGPDAWLDHTGLIPDSAHPISKLRWVASHEPSIAQQITSSLLPHEWLTWLLQARVLPPSTDRSDASATGYWSPSTGSFSEELVDLAFGRTIQFPAVLAPGEPAGISPSGMLIAAGSGDNAATHLALDTSPGDVIISVGTSTTVSMRTDSSVRDPSGTVDTMADTRTGYIPIIAMLNGARVFTSTARLLGINLEQLNALASASAADADGLLLMPFLDGERNPREPLNSGRFIGLGRASLSRENIARAALLGLGCATANALDSLTETCGSAGRVFLVGGAARSVAFRQILADLTAKSIRVPHERQHAAFGAARQAAWTLLGTLPEWPTTGTDAVFEPTHAGWARETRAAYNLELGRSPAAPDS